ncbi:hypothetical protein BASA81_013069 [Batrachochytrium salamandrivorans]|nr:hypothetical protein BASA81_013069 [Batrachochytrium salamandrivorans]
MFGPALTLVLALASSAVIAVPMIDNVYKRAVASLDSSSTEFPFHFPESLNLGADDFKVVNSYTDDAGISHVYGAHMVNGAPIANHQAAAHAKNGQVTCFSSSFGTDQHLAKRDLAVSEPKATMSFEEASSIVSAKLEIPVYSEFKHTLEYVAQSDGKVVYSYKFQLRNDLVTKKLVCSRTKFDSEQPAGSAANVAATAVNLFYVTNVVHDIAYQYGFTEIAGNFQKSNFDKGGEVRIFQTSAVGFRSHLYTTDMTVNPLTYGNVKFAGGAYAVGVVWASMLWQVYWNLVEKHGFSTNLYDAKQSAGNVVAMKIFIGGLTLQPCNPGLLGARNAIIDADKLHYNGTHKCEIFKGFAKRGLGSKITSGYTDDFSIPDECQ